MPQFARYVLCAGAASAGDLIVAQALLFVAIFQTGPLFGTPIIAGALTGMSLNFILSRLFVFDADGRRAHEQMLSFFGVSMTTLALKLAVGFALLALLQAISLPGPGLLPVSAPESRLAQFGAMGLVAIYSFYAHKKISFGGGFRALIKKASPADA